MTKLEGMHLDLQLIKPQIPEIWNFFGNKERFFKSGKDTQPWFAHCRKWCIEGCSAETALQQEKTDNWSEMCSPEASDNIASDTKTRMNAL